MPFEKALRDAVRQELEKLLPEYLSNQGDSAEPKYLDTAEAARITGLSKSWFNGTRSYGAPDHPDFIRVGRRVLYPLDDLHKFMEKRREAQK